MSEAICDTKEQKHRRLDNSIERICEVREKAQRLLDKIKDVSEPEETNKASVRPAPALRDILNEGADRVFNYCDELSSTLQQIEDELF